MFFRSSRAGTSDRGFGIFMSAVLAILGGLGAYQAWPPVSWTLLVGAAATLLLIALRWPARLALLKRGWLKLGDQLGRVVNPIVLGLLYFGLFTPVALIGRMLGRDELRLRPGAAPTYWIKRRPPGPSPESFRNQF